MKNLTLILLCIASLGLASCKKDTIINQTTPNRTVVVNVATNAWTLSGDGFTYSAVLNIPEIDQYSLDNEAVLVYISYDNGATYLQLPFVYNVEAYSTVLSKGKVQIDIESSDFQNATPKKPTSTVRVKVVLIAADNIS
ncbi:MAG TPA: hypothetical protein VL088_08390 [Pedobacter sp.]|nr:hypothetical protein [Pedobacter sp.]